MSRMKLQDEVEGLQIQLAQVLNEKAASINEDTLRYAVAPHQTQSQRIWLSGRCLHRRRCSSIWRAC